MITLASATMISLKGWNILAIRGCFALVLDEFIRWTLVIAEVARTPNRQSLSDLVKKVFHFY